MFTEASGLENNIYGFVRPLLEGINLAKHTPGMENHSVPVKNPFSRPLRQIPFQESLDDINIWSAVAFTLHKAFLQALVPSVMQIDFQNYEQEGKPEAERGTQIKKKPSIDKAT
jgi:hypothetical protein